MKDWKGRKEIKKKKKKKNKPQKKHLQNPLLTTQQTPPKEPNIIKKHKNGRLSKLHFWPWKILWNLKDSRKTIIEALRNKSGPKISAHTFGENFDFSNSNFQLVTFCWHCCVLKTTKYPNSFENPIFHSVLLFSKKRIFVYFQTLKKHFFTIAQKSCYFSNVADNSGQKHTHTQH